MGGSISGQLHGVHIEDRTNQSEGKCPIFKKVSSCLNSDQRSEQLRVASSVGRTNQSGENSARLKKSIVVPEQSREASCFLGRSYKPE